MTSPGISVEGSLGATISINAAATHEFVDFVVPRGARQVTFHFRVDGGPGILEIRRLGVGGSQRHVPVINVPAVVPVDEYTIVLDYPLQRGDQLRSLYTNNNAGAVIATLSVTYDRPTRR